MPVGLQKHNTVYETLKRVADSEPRDLDAWQISLSAGASPLALCPCILALMFLVCLHVVYGKCVIDLYPAHRPKRHMAQARRVPSPTCRTPWRWRMEQGPLRPR